MYINEKRKNMKNPTTLFRLCLAFRAVIKANCEFFSALFRAVIKNGKSFVFVFIAFVACSVDCVGKNRVKSNGNAMERTPSLSFPPHFPTIFHPVQPQLQPFPSLAFCLFYFWFLLLHGIDMAKVVGLPLFRGLWAWAVMTAKSA